MRATILILMKTHFYRIWMNKIIVLFCRLNKGEKQQGKQIGKDPLHQFYKCIAAHGQSCPQCHAFGLHQTGKPAKSSDSKGQGCFLNRGKSICNFLYSTGNLK